MELEKNKENKNNLRNLGILGASITAVFASFCCVFPLLLVTIGVSGAWISNFKIFEPYRPIFTVVTCLLLGFAMYMHYGAKNTSCIAGQCKQENRKKINSILIWGFTFTILGLLIFPYVVIAFSNTAQKQKIETKQVTLIVEGMTCITCTLTVQKSLKKLEGVKDATVTFDPPQTVIIYEPKKVSIEKMIEATTKAGYPSKYKKE